MTELVLAGPAPFGGDTSEDGSAAGSPADEQTGPAKRSGYPFAAALIVVVAAGLVRVVVHARWGELTGLDTGNWFTIGNAWLGDRLSDGAASVYPPVVPVSAALLGRFLDPIAVMLVLGLVATLVHGAAAAFLLWRCGCGWWTVPLVAALVSGSAVGEAVAWGGTPQLLGLGLALLVLYYVARLLLAPSVRTAAALGASGVALAATSHLVLAETALAAAVMVVLRLLSPVPAPTRARVGRLALLWTIAAVPSVLLLPLYADLAATVGGSFAERQATQPHAEFLHAVEAVSRELPMLWKTAIVFSLLLPAVLWRERHRVLWLVTTSLGAVLVGVGVFAPEPRFAYLVPLLVLCGLGLLASAVDARKVARSVRVSVTVAAVAGCTASAVLGLLLFPGQVRYYGELAPAGTTEALKALRAETDPGDLVAVPPVRGLPFGWWVEGYGQRAAYVGSSSKWLNFPRERDRAQISVRLFSAGDALSDRWLASARDAGIDVVYVPSNYDGLTRKDIENFRAARPELVILSDSAATILEVPK